MGSLLNAFPLVAAEQQGEPSSLVGSHNTSAFDSPHFSDWRRCALRVTSRGQTASPRLCTESDLLGSYLYDQHTHGDGSQQVLVVVQPLLHFLVAALKPQTHRWSPQLGLE